MSERRDAEPNRVAHTPIEVNDLSDVCQIEPSSPVLSDAAIAASSEPATLALPISEESQEIKSELAVHHDLSGSLAKLEELVDKRFEQVFKTFEEKLTYDRVKEDQISRLHDELQAYKADLVAKTARPLTSGIIRFHDDVGRIVEALRKRDVAELTPDRFFKVIQGFQQDIEIVLSDNGVEAYSEPGDTFDPHRQKALATVPSTDAALTGHIAARLRPGFEQSGTVLQKERVAVYVLADAGAPSSNDDIEDARTQKPATEGEHK
jgi:molecular chaperone GrpE